MAMRVLGEGTAHDSAENVLRRRESPRRRRRAVGKSQARGWKDWQLFISFFGVDRTCSSSTSLPPSSESLLLGGSLSLQACKWRSQVGKHLANHKAQGSIPVSLAVAPLSLWWLVPSPQNPATRCSSDLATLSTLVPERLGIWIIWSSARDTLSRNGSAETSTAI